MRIRICIYLLTISAIVACSCRTEVKYSVNDHHNLLQSVELVKTGELVFALDSTTTPDVLSVGYLEVDKDSLLTFLNPLTRYIYYYDLSSKKFKSKLHLEKGEPNGVGKVTGFYQNSVDSIFILDPWNGKLSLLNHDGKKIDSFSLGHLKSDKHIISPYPSLVTENPMLVKDGSVYFTGSALGEFDDENIERPMGISYKLGIPTPSYYMPFPEIYRNANWAGGAYRLVYTTFTPATTVYSFPAEHYLYEMELPGKRITKHYAGSKFIDTIQSFDKPGKIKDKALVSEYFATNPSYSTVIYDKYRHLYYRFADHPLKKYAAGFKDQTVKAFSIIILDSNFNWLGETQIPKLSHSRLCFFVSQKGLHLRKYDKDDEHLVFSTFIPTKVDSQSLTLIK